MRGIMTRQNDRQQQSLIQAPLAPASRLADEHARAVVPILKELRAAGCISKRSIARALNERGVPTPRGRRWYPTSVRNLLTRLQRFSSEYSAP